MHVCATKDCRKFSHAVLWPRWMCLLRMGSQMTSNIAIVWQICAHEFHTIGQIHMSQWMETARLLLDYYAHEDAILHEVIIMMEEMRPCSFKPRVQETVKWMASPRVSMLKKLWTTVNAEYYWNFLEYHLCPTLCLKWPHLLQSGSVCCTMKFGVIWQGWWLII
jgi:hypothetical protein